MTRSRGYWERALQWLNSPQDGAGIAAFRVLFGALMVFSVVRFWAYGWIDEMYISPAWHFSYLGFGWVKPWPGVGMYVHYAVMGVAALAVMLGWRTRYAAAVFFLAFTYAELIEKASYLNHYYFVSLAALLLVFVPTDSVWSVDGWLRHRRGEAFEEIVGRWAYVVLRSQVALVYFFAGFAKLNADWLFRAEPLRTWLLAYLELPVIGPVFGYAWVAFAMCWAGAFYDLTIVGWLSWSKTRPWAYAVSVGFHVTVWLLFPIGVFSWVMLVSATLFFAPDWPRRFVNLLGKRRVVGVGGVRAKSVFGQPVRSRIGGVGVVLVAGYLVVQVLVPLRFVLYPGNVNWTEEGFRFSWRVMLIEKTGQVEYEVRDGGGRVWRVYPRGEMTGLLYRMIKTQPDMNLENELRIAERFADEGYGSVRVYAHSWAALNGRASQRMVDPEVDLAAERRGLGAAKWIVGLAAGLN